MYKISPVEIMFLFLLQECVPVILSDEVELPFQNVVDYTQISIKWPSTRIGPELLQYLESIPGQMQNSSHILLCLVHILQHLAKKMKSIFLHINTFFFFGLGC